MFVFVHTHLSFKYLVKEYNVYIVSLVTFTNLSFFHAHTKRKANITYNTWAVCAYLAFDELCLTLVFAHS